MMDLHLLLLLLLLLLPRLPVIIVMMGVSPCIVMLEAFHCEVSIHTVI
jgi:hypothetical protein